ncbi:MAG TPA: hypothetical protein VJQ46_13410, partial [Gemmatimonadales bacterium]|nr:hypothetical protein [Gemmatimonadales bacterium]
YPKPAIWLIRPDGTDERRLTSEPYLPSGKGLDWSPDGAWLVTTSLSTIDLLEVATGNVLPLAWANQGSDWPSWKP